MRNDQVDSRGQLKAYPRSQDFAEAHRGGEEAPTVACISSPAIRDLVEGEDDAEGRANADLAFHLDAPAVRVDDAAGDGQAEAGA